MASRIYWVYVTVLAYLGTVAVLQSEVSIRLPMSSVVTVSNLLPYVSFGLLWMIILIMYSIRLKKHAQTSPSPR
jgi:hypothetical protein